MSIFYINEKYLIIALNYFPKLTSKSLSCVSHSLSCHLGTLVTLFNNQSRLNLLKYKLVALMEGFLRQIANPGVRRGQCVAVAWKYLDYSVKLVV